jgi:hypothetical protein
MSSDAPDFYLASAEGHGLDKPRKCYRLRRLSGDHRDDLLLIRVDPPLEGRHHGWNVGNVDTLVVATRHVGDSLFPIARWPVPVHVATSFVNDLEEREYLHDHELRNFAWGELYEHVESIPEWKPQSGHSSS